MILSIFMYQKIMLMNFRHDQFVKITIFSVQVV